MSALFRKKSTLDDLRDYTLPALDELRRKARIVLVDAGHLAHFEFFMKHGYTPAYLEYSRDVKAVEGYDVILYDLGEGGKYLGGQQEGASLLAEIRTHSLFKTIVGYAGNPSAPGYGQAAALCDFTIPEDIGTAGGIAVLEQAIRCSFDPAAQWEKLRNLLTERGVPAKSIASLEHAYVRSVKSGQEFAIDQKLQESLPDGIEPLLLHFAAGGVFKLFAG